MDHIRLARSKMTHAQVAAGFKIAGGLLLGCILIVALAVLLVQSVTGVGSAGATFLFIALGAAAATGLVWSGGRDFLLAARCRRLLRIVGNGRRVTVRALCATMNMEQPKLLDSVRRMLARGFLPGACMDLERKELVLVREALPPPPNAEDPTVLKEVTVRSKLPPAAAGVVLLAGIPAMLSGTYYLIGVPVVAAVLFLALYKVMGKHVAYVEEDRPAPPPVLTGNQVADEAIANAREQIARLRSMSRGLSPGHPLGAPVHELLQISEDILAELEKAPSKVRQVRQFLSYYLPTTIKLLSDYRELEAKPVKGESIRQSLEKIEGMLGTVVQVFRKELDHLYEDKALDISTDIEVMQGMLRQQGFGAGAAGPFTHRD